MRIVVLTIYLLIFAPIFCAAQDIRLGLFHVELDQKGPGLLLDKIVKAKDEQVLLVGEIIAQNDPDILVLLGFDFDHDLLALRAFSNLISEKFGTEPYAHAFSILQNRGIDSGLDLDGDDLLRGPADAFGFGEFEGQGAMAILSRFPIDHDKVQDFSRFLWSDMPDANMPLNPDGTPFYSTEIRSVLRLSTSGHWVVPIDVGSEIFSLMVSHSTPPVFDGPEDANGKRNLDEARFWELFLNGEIGSELLGKPVLMAGLNADPYAGEGAREQIRRLLSHPMLQDPEPQSEFGLATTDWRDPIPGDLRVDYILPSTNLRVKNSGVFWPDSGSGADLVAKAQAAGIRHKLVWVDLILP